jgi:hypothetical protein
MTPMRCRTSCSVIVAARRAVLSCAAALDVAAKQRATAIAREVGST